MFRLANAKYFTKSDMASAYWHVALNNESSYLITVQTGFDIGGSDSSFVHV